MDSFYVEMVSWKRSQRGKIWIPNLTEYKIYSWKLGDHEIKRMPTHYPNINKAIDRINELISLFHKTFLHPVHNMPITVELFTTGYPKVW